MEELKEDEIKHDYVSPTLITNLDAIDTVSNNTESSVASGHEVHKYKNEPPKYLSKLKSVMDTKQSLVESNAIAKIDHVYEEVNALECDIMDYYEKYSPTTAKTLINTLFLPRHKICKQCANLQGSPVYSDRLIYAKKPLYAKEVDLFQQNDIIQFRYLSEDDKDVDALFLQYDNVEHCLLVYNYVKPNACSIFYSHGSPQDVFDLRMTLKPNIILIGDYKMKRVNTEFYHRRINHFYTRVSRNGISPTAFHVNHSNILSSIKHIGYDTDLQNWMNYRNDVFRSHSLKQDDATDPRANRSSLLLLEPLLLMPELGSSGYRHVKNRIAQSEHVKIVKIVIAYTLSFFILVTITFYIVYFT
ncbi:uncharacterized protein LOC108623294 [Ceratina calcarata]|uniref:Uncharacterized protein LOC108623294 n=1 Tax=Ceratina calcarata TaxID=156304 RepID=A0AAJ7N4G3_9HYME|nr:uncharacterized protein LOC108623294 [Ceratina calcarata]